MTLNEWIQVRNKFWKFLCNWAEKHVGKVQQDTKMAVCFYLNLFAPNNTEVSMQIVIEWYGQPPNNCSSALPDFDWLQGESKELAEKLASPAARIPRLHERSRLGVGRLQGSPTASSQRDSHLDQDSIYAR